MPGRCLRFVPSLWQRLVHIEVRRPALAAEPTRRTGHHCIVGHLTSRPAPRRCHHLWQRHCCKGHRRRPDRTTTGSQVAAAGLSVCWQQAHVKYLSAAESRPQRFHVQPRAHQHDVRKFVAASECAGGYAHERGVATRKSTRWCIVREITPPFCLMISSSSRCRTPVADSANTRPESGVRGAFCHFVHKRTSLCEALCCCLVGGTSLALAGAAPGAEMSFSRSAVDVDNEARE